MRRWPASLPAATVGLAALYGLARPEVWPWLAAVAGLALLLRLAYRRPPEVAVEREVTPARAFEGSGVEVRLRLRVTARWPTLLTLTERPPLTVIPDRPAALTGLFWGASEHPLEYRVIPNRRGAHAWPGLRLSWSDPLGLFHNEVRLPNLAPPDGFDLLVYPSTHLLPVPDLARPLLADGPPARRRALEDPASLAGARDYAPGDPLNRVHWRQTARRGLGPEGRLGLVVRELESVAAAAVLVHLDTDAAGRSGAVYLESAARLAASLVREAAEAGLRVGVSSPAGASEPGTGVAALERALAHLALARPSPGASHEVPLPPPGANLVVVTFAAPPDLVESAVRARGRAARVLVVALPEGFYLEPGEGPRPLFVAPPQAVRDLAARAGLLEAEGVRVVVLRGDGSVLDLADR